MKKYLSILLTFIMLINMSSTAFAENIQKVISVDGYTFSVEQNDEKAATVSYVEDEKTYRLSFDKTRHTIDLEISDSLSRNISGEATEHYSVFVDEADPNTREIEGVSLVSSDGMEYDLSTSQSRIGFVLPIGIAISYALVEALLIISCAIIIGGVAYIVAEQAMSAIKKQSEYKYYQAVIRTGSIYIGNGISTPTAKSVMGRNSKTDGVFAVSAQYARGLCDSLGGYRFDPAHGSTSGFWDHYHCTIYPNAHCWYF